MSDDRDTDDTDVLLNSDPMGGLFLGLSLKELTEKHKSLSPLITTPPSPPAKNDLDVDVDPGLNDLVVPPPSSHDGSDFFNSQGQLVLEDGLSEWTDSELEAEISRPNDPSGHDPDPDSDSSDSSFTYKPTTAPETAPTTEIPQNPDEIQAKSEVDEPHPPPHSHSFLPQFHSHGHGRVVDINLQNPATGWNIPLPPVPCCGEMKLIQGAGGLGSYLNEKGQQVFTRAPNFRSGGGGGVSNKRALEDKPRRKLSDAQIQEEVRKMYENPEEPEPEVEVGVKTTTTPKVLRFADQIATDMEQDHKRSNPGQGQEAIRSASEPLLLQSPSFNFLPNGSPSVKFESQPKPRSPFTLSADTRRESGGESGSPSGRKKQIPASKGKRKHQNMNQPGPAGDAPTPPTPTSIPSPSTTSTNPGSPELTVPLTLTPETEQAPPPPPESTPPLLLPSASVPYSTKVIRGQRRSKPKPSPSGAGGGGPSFAYGESETELSPIRMEERAAAVATATGTTTGDGFGAGPLPPGVMGGGAALEELKSIWGQIQRSRAQLREFGGGEGSDTDSDDTTTPEERESRPERKSFIEDLGQGDPPSEPNEPRNRPHSSTSGSGPSSARRPLPLNVPPHLSIHYTTPGQDAELDALLLEADINPSDFEDIVSNLDLSDVEVGAGIDDLLAQIQNPASSADDRDSAALSHWAASGAAVYVDKYYEEKFRRQECEVEISRLHQENLLLRQRVAVGEGNGRRKDATIAKIARAWKEVSREWREFEETTRTEFEGLKKDHAHLLRVAEEDAQTLERVGKELTKALEVGETFKTKFIGLEEAKDKEIGDVRREMDRVLGNCDKIREEKDSALKSLTESQIQVESLTRTKEALDTELNSLKTAHKSAQDQVVQVLNQNSQLEFLLQEVKLEGQEAKDKFTQELNQILTSSLAEKSRLRQEYEEERSRSLKEEGERLHAYYNKRLGEALTAAGEKAARAQATLVESMKRAATEGDKKLAECKIRYHSDLTRIKTIYEVEMQELKKDNAQKQLLITTTAQQLQSGGVVRSEAIDRLQTIVSNFPNIRDSSSSSAAAAAALLLGGGCGDRPSSANNNHNHLSPSQQLSNIREKMMNYNSTPVSTPVTTPRTTHSSSSNNKEYAKFVQNLEAKSNNGSGIKGASSTSSKLDNLNLPSSNNTTSGSGGVNINKLSGTSGTNK